MAIDTNSLSGGPGDAELLRLRQQLQARDDVIQKLNRRIGAQPELPQFDEPEPDQDALALAWAGGRLLEAELQRMRQVQASQLDEIAALRRQLEVYERLGFGTAVSGLLRARKVIRKVSRR